MKLCYAFLLSLTAFTQFCQAQGVVTLRDEDDNIVNGTVISGPCLSTTDTVSLFTMLNGSTASTINVRRYEMWPIAGSKNFYCWGVCYLPVLSGVHYTWVSSDPLPMSPSVSYNNFHAYYQPQGQPGTARFRYVWYDLSNPTGADSSWVDIDFCGLVGIGEHPTSLNTLNAWPQPNLGQDIQLDYTLDQLDNGTELVVYTILGEQLQRVGIAANAGRIVLPVSGFTSGVYFANIEREGRVLTTHRLVIAR